MADYVKKAAIYSEPEVKYVGYYNGIISSVTIGNEPGYIVNMYKSRGGFQSQELVRSHIQFFIPEYIFASKNFAKTNKGTEVTLCGKLRMHKDDDSQYKIASVNVDKVILYRFDTKANEQAAKTYGVAVNGQVAQRQSYAPAQPSQAQSQPQQRQPEPEDTFGEDIPF